MRLYYPRNRFDASKIEEDGEKSRTTHTHKDLTRQLNNSMKFVVVMVWVIKIRRVLALIAFLFFSFLFFFFSLLFISLFFGIFFSPSLSVSDKQGDLGTGDPVMGTRDGE